MPDQDFPSEVPVCVSLDEKNSAYQDAKDNQRPFLAVTDEEAMPGWRAVYDMDTTGEDREEWYELSESALDDLKDIHGDYKEYIEKDSVVEGCSIDEGALHGLSKTDAQDLANHFADFVWNTDCWESITLKEVYDRQQNID